MIVRGSLRAWALLVAFSLLLFLITACSYSSLGVVLPEMIKSIGMSWSEAGLGFTLLGMANGAAAYVPAILIRRLGVPATLMIGAVVIAAGFLGMAAATNVALYGLGAALTGGGFVLLALIPGTYVLGHCFEKRALPFAVYYTIGGLGAAAGPFMVIAIQAATHDWRIYWVVSAILCIVAGALCAGLVMAWKPPVAETTGKAASRPLAAGDFSVGEAVRTPQFIVLAAAYLCHLLCTIATTSFGVSHLVEHGVAQNTASAVLALEGLAAALARLAAGALGDRMNPKKLLLLSTVALAVGSAALATAAGPLAMLLYAVGIGAGFGVTSLAVTLLVMRYFGPSRNLELFAIVCLSGAISALGPVVSGVLRDLSGGFALPFWIYGAIAAAVAVAVGLMRAPGHRETPAAPLAPQATA